MRGILIVGQLGQSRLTIQSYAARSSLSAAMCCVFLISTWNIENIFNAIITWSALDCKYIRNTAVCFVLQRIKTLQQAAAAKRENIWQLFSSNVVKWGETRFGLVRFGEHQLFYSSNRFKMWNSKICVKVNLKPGRYEFPRCDKLDRWGEKSISTCVLWLPANFQKHMFHLLTIIKLCLRTIFIGTPAEQLAGEAKLIRNGFNRPCVDRFSIWMI